MSDLELPSSVRPHAPRRFNTPHLFTAAGWLLVGGLFVAGVMFASLDALVGIGAALICVATSVGLTFKVRLARAAAVVVSFAVGLPILVLSLAAFYPFEPFWWAGAALILFCAWTVFFVTALWPDYVPQARVAA